MSEGNQRSDLVIVPVGSGHLALSVEAYGKAMVLGKQIASTEQRAGESPNTPQKRFVTAEVMSELTGAPASWFYEKARRKEIPFVRLGKYVRFDEEEVLKFLRREPETLNRDGERHGLRL